MNFQTETWIDDYLDFEISFGIFHVCFHEILKFKEKPQLLLISIPGDALAHFTYEDLHPRLKILPQKYR